MAEAAAAPDLRSQLLAAARAAGFPLAETIDIAPAMPALASHVARYDHWLERGRAGAMAYLERGRDRRADPRVVMPEAESMLCVAIPYPRGAAGAASAAQGPRYARYLQGPDYHEEIKRRLEGVMREVARARAGDQPGLKWKVCVDTSAVLERSWAALAGLGWIGKNTMLIHPKLGSYLFLGEVLLNEPTGRGPAPIADLCGHCERCLQGCPTGALAPHDLDTENCVSYWTLEKRGEIPLAPERKSKFGAWIAGCDACQEVCPFNLKPAREEVASAAEAHAGVTTAMDASATNDATRAADWLALLEETEEQYRARIADSALARVKPEQFSRNLAIALANAAASGELAALDPATRARLRTLTEARLGASRELELRAEWARCHELLARL